MFKLVVTLDFFEPFPEFCLEINNKMTLSATFSKHVPGRVLVFNICYLAALRLIFSYIVQPMLISALI